MLEDQGYSLMQGYLFGGPMAEAELLGQLERVNPPAPAAASAHSRVTAPSK